MSYLLPLLTALLATVFTGLLVRQFLARRKSYQLVWSLALALFAFAAFAEFYSEVWGWHPDLYRFYYVSAAALVGFLGAGTALLIFSRRIALGFLCYFIVVTAVMLLKALGAEIAVSALVAGKEVAGQAMPGEVRVFTPLLTVPGSLILILGALYSWFRGRGTYNLYIAGGAFVLGGSGALARFGWPDMHYVGLLVGLVLLFYGFLVSMKQSGR